MSQKPVDLIQERILPTVHIWDESINDFLLGHKKQYRVKRSLSLIVAHVFDSASETANSDSIDAEGYDKGLLFIDIVWTASPTYVVVELEFSLDNANWYKYNEDIYTDLRYVPAQSTIQECVTFPALAKYMRVKVVSSGCDGSNKATVSIQTLIQS